MHGKLKANLFTLVFDFRGIRQSGCRYIQEKTSGAGFAFLHKAASRLAHCP